MREVNADANKLKSLVETGITFEAFSQVFLDEKKKSNMKAVAYKTLEGQVARVAAYLGKVKLGDIDSDFVQQMIFSLAKQGYSESVMIKDKLQIKQKYAEIEREHKRICGSPTFPFGSSGHSCTLQTHRKICKTIGLSRTATAPG